MNSFIQNDNTVSRSTSGLVAHLRIFRLLTYEGEIWSLFSVTFGQKSSKLNSRPVFSSRLQGMYNICSVVENYPTSHCANICLPVPLHILLVHTLQTRARPDWAYEFPDRTGPDTQFCRTGPAGPDWIRTYNLNILPYK